MMAKLAFGHKVQNHTMGAIINNVSTTAELHTKHIKGMTKAAHINKKKVLQLVVMTHYSDKMCLYIEYSAANKCFI